MKVIEIHVSISEIVTIWFQVAGLLARDDLYLNNEKDLFDAVINWISSNSSNRVQKRGLLR